MSCVMKVLYVTKEFYVLYVLPDTAQLCDVSLLICSLYH